jgi:predicted alpha-1,2-mannosidase
VYIGFKLTGDENNKTKGKELYDKMKGLLEFENLKKSNDHFVFFYLKDIKFEDVFSNDDSLLLNTFPPSFPLDGSGTDYKLTIEEYYKNVFDSSIGYMRPKLANGKFRTNFDPMDTHGQGFIEGNACNYGLYVPQDIETMINIMGGKNKFCKQLDSLFNIEIDEKYISQHEDITRDGIIGNYVHGNEPGHHIPYLYNWTDQPSKTQERVRMIMNTMYSSSVNGLCGNDDAGQMSAWYIFSSLGFYPVTPGSSDYAIGSPIIKEAVLHLENGNTFTIKTINQSKKNVYVKNITLNGNSLIGYKLNHKDIINGGVIVFEMSSTPI